MLLRLHTVLQKVLVLTRGVVRTRPASPALKRVGRTRLRSQMVSGECVLAYARCRENAFLLRAPFILDPSGPTAKFEKNIWYSEMAKNDGKFS